MSGAGSAPVVAAQGELSPSGRSAVSSARVPATAAPTVPSITNTAATLSPAAWTTGQDRAEVTANALDPGPRAARVSVPEPLTRARTRRSSATASHWAGSTLPMTNGGSSG